MLYISFLTNIPPNTIAAFLVLTSPCQALLDFPLQMERVAVSQTQSGEVIQRLCATL